MLYNRKTIIQKTKKWFPFPFPLSVKGFCHIKIMEKFLILSAWLLVGGLSVWLFRKALKRKIHAYYKRAAVRVYKRINNMIQETSPSAVFNYLRKVNPYVFEELVLLAYEKKGYQVKRNERYSGDGGVDGHVVINRIAIPVQSKRYAAHIKKQHVAAFEKLLVERNKPYGFFVHTGRTGKGSKGYEYPHVRFVSGNKLIALISG